MNAHAHGIIASLTGEGWFAKDTGRNDPTSDEIARVAYRLYEARGREDGHDIEDWLIAEDRLANGLVPPGYRGPLSPDGGTEGA